MRIAQCKLEYKANCETLIEEKLTDMGLGVETERENGAETRTAAKGYYLSLVEEEEENSEIMLLSNSVDGNELAVIGFVAGYEACLYSHGKR